VTKKGGYSSNVESIHGAVHKLAKISYENKKQTEIHEFDAFCNSLAIQLKKMPLRQALICQEKLQAVMTQHRLSLFPQKTLLRRYMCIYQRHHLQALILDKLHTLFIPRLLRRMTPVIRKNLTVSSIKQFPALVDLMQNKLY
jgi:hypothetical protein